MTRLSDSINKLGTEVLRHESGFQLMERIKNKKILGSDIYQTLDELCQIFTKFQDKLTESGLKIPLPDTLIQSEDYSSYLGLSLLDHDLRNVGGIFAGYTSLLEDAIKDESAGVIDDILHRKSYFLAYENIRIGLTLISYLSTGEQKFLVPISTNQVPVLLEKMLESKPNCYFDFGDVQTILSDQYGSVLQLAKNAKKILDTAKKSSQSPEGFDDIIKIEFKKYGGLTNLIEVNDSGTGIHPELLSEIFGVYTEGGTGVGLQVVQRILDLRGGFAEVTSTKPEMDTFTHYTFRVIFQEPYRTGQNQPQGTSFRLYFPRA